MRVVVTTAEDGSRKLGFVFPEGPVLPRPDRELVAAVKKRVRPEPEVRRAKGEKDVGGSGGGAPDVMPPAPKTGGRGKVKPLIDLTSDESKGGIVPQVPLKG